MSFTLPKVQMECQFKLQKMEHFQDISDQEEK